MLNRESVLSGASHAVGVRGDRLMDAINSIDRIFSVSVSMQAVTDVVTEECARLTHADGVTLFTLENERLSAKAAVGALGSALLELPLGDNPPSSALKTNHAIRCDNSDSDDRRLRRASSKKVARSSVSAPFVFGEGKNSAGVLHVVSTSRGAFSDEDMDIIVIFAHVAGSAIRNALRYDQAIRISHEDALTGLLNRRAFEEHLRMLKKEQSDHERPYSVILIDVDKLKIINDIHGHLAGDEALKVISLCIRSQIRKSDVVYRLGGDEFGVLLPQTTLIQATEIIKRIESAVGGKCVHGRPLSVSSGTCEAQPQEKVSMLISRADQLLYKAKHQHAQYREPGEIPDTVKLSRH